MPKLYFDNQRYADLPLHYGKVPPWLAERMSKLGGAIIESVAMEYGKSEVLSRMSDPMWFQALGCVLGMDWHSSGITTSVMGALKKALNPKFSEIGIYICGGKGNHSRQTPSELLSLAERTGLNGTELVKNSRLSAKVDNNAIQDGFQIYLHTFMVSNEGEWAVIQQGMNDESGMARRYHWHSKQLTSFVEEPHSFIYGANQGEILNLTDKNAVHTKTGLLELVKESPSVILPEIRKIVMPSHHDVKEKDVDLKRLGSVLALAHERQVSDFESLLLLEGVGPRAIQSLTLVSEIIHGTPSRFTDPARFSFAHGGKDGHPFPVPTKTYDQTIDVLRNALEKAKLGITDKNEAIKNLTLAAQAIEKNFMPNANFYKVIEQERRDSYKYGGRTVFGKTKPPKNVGQLSLF
ncbi:MAG: hypothetical protein K0S32_711 [Bacteroidetes bacterium]|jgi:hypothetical protein|nr:hypothetical protein [Bacteroidota bacterium]